MITSQNSELHVRVWAGSCSAQITEMKNAGKRGKTCRMLRIMAGYKPDSEVLHFMGEILPNLDLSTSLDDLVIFCRALKAECGTFEFYEETIRGIDAPQPELLAGIPGIWSASADENGVSVADHTDRFNEPRSITSGQSAAKAYGLAKKCWRRVEQANSYSEVLSIFESAGVQLHSYCGMD